MEPDYSKYSLDELNEALTTIDRELYPEREAEIKQQIQIRLESNQDEHKQNSPSTTSKKKFGVGSQLFLGALSLVFLYSGIDDLINGSTYARGGGTYTQVDNPTMFYLHSFLYIGLGAIFIYFIIVGRLKNAKGT